MTNPSEPSGPDAPRTPLWDRPPPGSPALGADGPVGGHGPSVTWDDDPAPRSAPGTSAAPRHARRKGRSSRSSMRSTVEWVAVIVGALVVALVVKTFLFQAFYIPSASMEPTLRKGDRVLVNKLSYDLHDIHRGDVVVFELPPEKVGADGIKDLIKRVIGLPGDVIETRDGIVYINGEKLDEPYLARGVTTDKPPIPSRPCPTGTSS